MVIVHSYVSYQRVMFNFKTITLFLCLIVRSAVWHMVCQRKRATANGLCFDWVLKDLYTLWKPLSILRGHDQPGPLHRRVFRNPPRTPTINLFQVRQVDMNGTRKQRPRCRLGRSAREFWGPHGNPWSHVPVICGFSNFITYFLPCFTMIRKHRIATPEDITHRLLYSCFLAGDQDRPCFFIG